MYLMPTPQEHTMLKDATWVENSAFWTLLELFAAEDWGAKLLVPLDTATTLVSELPTPSKFSTNAIASSSLRFWKTKLPCYKMQYENVTKNRVDREPFVKNLPKRIKFY